MPFWKCSKKEDSFDSFDMSYWQTKGFHDDNLLVPIELDRSALFHEALNVSLV
jgi:hypothetical protein